MSDFETIKEILTRAGVAFVDEEHVEPMGPPDNPTAPFHLEGEAKAITVYDYASEKLTPHNLGYGGFYSSWGFDKDGNLLSVGAWE